MGNRYLCYRLATVASPPFFSFYRCVYMDHSLLYEKQALRELKAWKKHITRRPSLFSYASKAVQAKLNNLLPEKVQEGITVVIKQMVRGVLFGAQAITPKINRSTSLEEQENLVRKRINRYKHAAAAEGGLTGAAGFLAGLADFPLLLSIKLKLLFDIAAAYGYNAKDYKERIYILYIFQLAFSSQQHRREVFQQMEHWEEKKHQLPDDIHQFDWTRFQTEYRDYIDLAKMAQLIPGIGAVVGYIVNYRLINQLGKTAMNAYRMRWVECNVGGELKQF